MGAVFRIFPLLLAVVIVYNIVAFSGRAFGGVSFLDAAGNPNMEALLNGGVFTIGMVSGPWVVTWGTLFVFFGLIALFVEMLGSASSSTVEIVNHGLSAVVLVFCMIEFFVVKGFNTNEFFYLTIMALIDVVAGFSISIINARRDFGGGHVAL